jgi:hypothetical protein
MLGSGASEFPCGSLNEGGKQPEPDPANWTKAANWRMMSVDQNIGSLYTMPDRGGKQMDQIGKSGGLR